MEQNENTLTEVMESSVTAAQPVATAEDLEFAIKTAEKTMDLVKKIKILAIKQTNKHDSGNDRCLYVCNLGTNECVLRYAIQIRLGIA